MLTFRLILESELKYKIEKHKKEKIIFFHLDNSTRIFDSPKSRNARRRRNIK